MTGTESWSCAAAGDVQLSDSNLNGLTDFMEQIPWKAESTLSPWRNSPPYMEPEDSVPCLQQLSLVLIPSKVNPIHTPQLFP
jgi:hypothetical protein